MILYEEEKLSGVAWKTSRRFSMGVVGGREIYRSETHTVGQLLVTSAPRDLLEGRNKNYSDAAPRES